MLENQIERDSDKTGPIGFYEREFYVLSNFSSFAIEWKGELWMTSEHAYHSEKFSDEDVIKEIKEARSADEALRIARKHKGKVRQDWPKVKLDVMADILRAKVSQHKYVKKKLMQTGDRELIEDSWRDDYWGWGPNKDGQNHLGKLWMKIREELKNK